jgi:hypothetical protein
MDRPEDVTAVNASRRVAIAATVRRLDAVLSGYGADRP